MEDNKRPETKKLGKLITIITIIIVLVFGAWYAIDPSFFENQTKMYIIAGALTAIALIPAMVVTLFKKNKR